ncbi:hypothetical protein FQA39_LY17664 [Lamprigera yunnana]|nr:hypothetical protein FQA39_LY17664 [Lamprigera yunnana]
MLCCYPDESETFENKYANSYKCDFVTESCVVKRKQKCCIRSYSCYEFDFYSIRNEGKFRKFWKVDKRWKVDNSEERTEENDEKEEDRGGGGDMEKMEE